MLLNGIPKRFYSYENPIVLPFKTYEQLKEIYDNYEREDETEKGLNIIKELFKKYCFDNDGIINLKLSHDEFILNIVADPSFERDILCQLLKKILKRLWNIKFLRKDYLFKMCRIEMFHFYLKGDFLILLKKISF